jgi:sec-independent protein translocase protein TatB
MVDFGFDKLALIGAVALIVLGPERLPRVARTVGHLIGKAQRYVADVKAEVNRSIEIEELKKMRSQVEGAARDLEQNVRDEMNQTSAMSDGWDSPTAADSLSSDGFGLGAYAYKPKKKNWRLRRSAMPQWYKRRHGVRCNVQSGAARVARFRPRRQS